MGQSNTHERSEDIDRPDVPSAEQDEHDDLFSFKSMCKVARQSDRLQALLAKNRLLKASVAKAEDREGAEDV